MPPKSDPKEPTTAVAEAAALAAALATVQVSAEEVTADASYDEESEEATTDDDESEDADQLRHDDDEYAHLAGGQASIDAHWFMMKRCYEVGLPAKMDPDHRINLLVMYEKQWRRVGVVVASKTKEGSHIGFLRIDGSGYRPRNWEGAYFDLIVVVILGDGRDDEPQFILVHPDTNTVNIPHFKQVAFQFDKQYSAFRFYLNEPCVPRVVHRNNTNNTERLSLRPNANLPAFLRQGSLEQMKEQFNAALKGLERQAAPEVAELFTAPYIEEIRHLDEKHAEIEAAKAERAARRALREERRAEGLLTHR